VRRRFAREASLAAVLAILCAIVARLAPSFFEPGNLRNVAIDSLPRLVAAIGMTLVMLAGEIDVSIGAQFAVCGVAMGWAARAGAPASLVIATALATGALLGALNGALVARFRVGAIIATLATMAILRGALRWITGGAWIQDLPSSFPWFGLGQARGQIAFAIAASLVFALAVVFLRWTSAGRAIAAVGSNREAARFAGIEPERVTFGVFVALGLLVALAALFAFPRYPAIEIEAGNGFELEVIACVVVGGTSIQGGRGTLVGTLLGVALLGTIGTVLVFLRVDPAWERAIQGAIILCAVVIDSALFSQRRGAHSRVGSGADA
jgi:rhamnose transport system permease protein